MKLTLELEMSQTTAHVPEDGDENIIYHVSILGHRMKVWDTLLTDEHGHYIVGYAFTPKGHDAPACVAEFATTDIEVLSRPAYIRTRFSMMTYTMKGDTGSLAEWQDTSEDVNELYDACGKHSSGVAQAIEHIGLAE